MKEDRRTNTPVCLTASDGPFDVFNRPELGKTLLNATNK